MLITDTVSRLSGQNDLRKNILIIIYNNTDLQKWKETLL